MNEQVKNFALKILAIAIGSVIAILIANALTD